MTFEEECTKLLKRRAERLLNFLELNAPPLILAHAVWQVYTAGLGACGEYLVKEQLREQTSRLRQVMARCQECDNRVAVKLSHPPVCESCDARMDAESRKLAEEAGIEWEGE